MLHKRSAPKWAVMVALVLLLATTALATAQSPDLHIPMVTGGEDTAQQAPEMPGDVEMPRPEGSRTEDDIASISAFNSNNFYVANSLGVGTDQPAHRLSVIGGPPWTSIGWQGSVELANGAAIGWRTNPAGQRFGMGHTNSGFYIFRTPSNPGTTGSAPVNDLFINNSGYVGIGTISPAHRLSIAGGSAWTTSSWEGVLDLPNASAIGWRTNANGINFGMGHTNGAFFLFHTASAPGTTGSEAVYDLTIKDNGSVGIGVFPADPNMKLQVKGTTWIDGGNLYVTGGGIIVNNQLMAVPDYVFEPEYPLMSLDELRAYVAKEKHLPNVPSEEEIHAGGLDLSNFQMKLLEKTEELTLYTLAQDEQIESLQQDNQAQEQEIERLQQNDEAKDEQLETLQQDNQAMQELIADLETRLAALEE